MCKYLNKRKRAMNINNQKDIREINKDSEKILCERELKKLIKKDKKTYFKN
ncbi:MAG: hypothetical protein ACLUOM_09835 [Staphylococcus simulans]